VETALFLQPDTVRNKQSALLGSTGRLTAKHPLTPGLNSFWTEKVIEVAARAHVCPEFPVNLLQTLPGDGPHRDFVRQSLGLKIGVMGKNPHMAKFVCNGCSQVVVIEIRKEVLIEAHDEHSEVTNTLNRNHSVVRCHYDVDILRHLHLSAELVYDRANSIHIGTWRRLWAGKQTTKTNDE